MGEPTLFQRIQELAARSVEAIKKHSDHFEIMPGGRVKFIKGDPAQLKASILELERAKSVLLAELSSRKQV